MKVADAAKLIGVSNQTIRVGIQQGIFPFGTVITLTGTGKRKKYLIFEEKVKEYIGGKNDN